MQTHAFIGRLAGCLPAALLLLSLGGCAAEDDGSTGVASGPAAFLEDQDPSLGTPDESLAQSESELSVCGVAGAIQGITDDKAKEWRLESASGTLMSGAQVGLRDTYFGKALKYGERKYGINL